MNTPLEQFINMIVDYRVPATKSCMFHFYTNIALNCA